MVKILIEPIKMKSLGGNPVSITGISPSDHDCIVGEIELLGGRSQRAKWNVNGTMRGGADSTNLDMCSEELADIGSLLQKLGHKN